jgi:GxxExxY protein
MIPEIKKQIPEIKTRDPLTEKIIACAYKVHSELGAGFNERIYHNALKFALKDTKLNYATEKQYR